GEFVPSDYVPPEDPSDPTDPSEIADTTATEAVTDPTDPTDITDPSDTTEDTTEITDVTDVPLTEAPAVPTRPLIVRVHSDDYSGYLDIALSVDGVETTHIVGNTEKARKYKDIADVDDVVAQPYIPYGYMCSNISYSEKGNTRVIDITIQKDPTAGLSLSFVIVVGNDGGEDVTNE
ncbi:MAG: hypothetical protein FWD71_08055, partial [Oscillospiraceae bacterium]|nr:hypothetical protein [Oscillospiraceae bacterium]